MSKWGRAKRTATSADNCPTCGRRITDYDDNGCEAPWGQRYCLEHLPAAAPSDGGDDFYGNSQWLVNMQPWIRIARRSARRTAHMSNDPTVINHCPFCGGGAITAGSDGTVDCSLCSRSFIVMEQPLYSNMPSAEQGAAVSALPSDPLKQEEPFEPGAEAVPPDTAGSDPAATDAVPPADGQTPGQRVRPTFATRSGVLVDADDFIIHHAVRLARGGE